MNNDNARAHLTLPNGESVDLTTYTGSDGQTVVDVQPLAKQGYFTYDPGFVATAACTSRITAINGNQGQLSYRGYPIEDLAAQGDFLRVAYLILFGELPSTTEYNDFSNRLKQQSDITPRHKKLLKQLPPNSHPMGMLMALISAMAAEQQDMIDLKDPEQRTQAAIELIAKMPTLFALCYRHSLGQTEIAPDHNQDYVANFLTMLFGDSPSSIAQQAMHVILILHADHEQNASTSTVRMAGSTGTHPYAAFVAGLSALWGPAHGGANEFCLKMLQEIGNISQIDHYIKRAKDPKDPFRLMGFGHRVYRNYDPRGKQMEKICHQILAASNQPNNPILTLAMALEKTAREDEYFIQRKLYPNIDFYSGITLNAMGLPTTFFTPVFALARTVGWLAHWLEMMRDPERRIARPRQLYQGPVARTLTTDH